MLPRLGFSIGVLAAACDGSTAAPPPSCGAPVPAFELTVRPPAGGSLPHDLRIDVTYGGTGHETFDLAAPTASPEVVFCGYVLDGATDAVTGTPPADATIDAVRCQLWTDGAARVAITATGFAELHETLEATTSDCGLTTTAAVADLAPATASD